MADFSFNTRTHSPDVLAVVSSALGTSGDNKFLHDRDRNKPVKLAGEGAHDICTSGDEIVGFIDSVKGDTVNEGNSFGGVRRGGTQEAVVGDNQGETAMALEDLVVADAQADVGTSGKPKVKTGSPSIHKWQVISVKGDGTAGTRVVLERV